jgi:hypothetical protein
MTFNVQMLPWAGSTAQAQTNDAEERADRVADAIFAIPPIDRPQVIAFQEVFDEDGRSRLVDRLGTTWKHMVKQVHSGGVIEDSGLMLFSTLPFLPLSTGGNFYEKFFAPAEAGDDTKASKGVAIVQVGAPAEITTIAFTHLQASYNAEDEHRDVRRKQLDIVHDALQAVAGDDWRNVILVGDLNIRGDSGAVSDEWATIFDFPGPKLTQKLQDGWRVFMHPPGPPKDVDPGYTEINLSTGDQHRFDYVCVSKPVNGELGLVPHHMFTRLRNQSDHFALEAVIEASSPNCTPEDAIDLLAAPPAAGSGPSTPSSIRKAQLNFVHKGSFQWLCVTRPGTYTVWTPPDLEVRLFAETNLSTPLQRLDNLVSVELSPDLASAFREQVVDPKGSTFVSRERFFIAARSKTQATGSRAIVVLEHLGESPQTAIHLLPHVRVASSFPAGQHLGGAADLCWFKATLPLIFAGTEHEERFVADNPTGGGLSLTLLDTAQQSLGSASGTQPEIEVARMTIGDEQVFLTMDRADIQHSGFGLTWKSPLSFLMLDQPMGLYVDDESGADWPGDDEINLMISMDAASLCSGGWDEADTGEHWPGLHEAIVSKAAVLLPGVKRLAFVSDIVFSYVEEDFNAQGYQLKILLPLGPSEPDEVERRVSLPVQDVLSNGAYTFYCRISRFAQ